MHSDHFFSGYFFFALYLFFRCCFFLRLRCLLPNCDAMTGVDRTWIFLCCFWYLIWVETWFCLLAYCCWWWWWWRLLLLLLLLQGTAAVYFSLLHIASNPWENFSTSKQSLLLFEAFYLFISFLFRVRFLAFVYRNLMPMPSRSMQFLFSHSPRQSHHNMAHVVAMQSIINVVHLNTFVVHVCDITCTILFECMRMRSPRSASQNDKCDTPIISNVYTYVGCYYFLVSIHGALNHANICINKKATESILFTSL